MEDFSWSRASNLWQDALHHSVGWCYSSQSKHGLFRTALKPSTVFTLFEVSVQISKIDLQKEIERERRERKRHRAMEKERERDK